MAVLFNPFGGGTPKDDAGETAAFEIVSAAWNGKGNEWNALGSNLNTNIEIKDGAICSITTDSNNDGELDVADWAGG